MFSGFIRDLPPIQINISVLFSSHVIELLLSGKEAILFYPGIEAGVRVRVRTAGDGGTQTNF